MKVLESHIEFSDGNLSLIAVLWQSNDAEWVRASYCTPDKTTGYGRLQRGETLTEALIQFVAGYGMELPDHLKEKYFGKERKWEI